ncbi:fascin domain-containing protein [Dactylosporangium sp. CA-233914]|uniref:fascin domain-containing protein n=1 Tax=Dactylosporangium sp. CA-233914 TaxID=3239934 RepID=UPI003D8C6370
MLVAAVVAAVVVTPIAIARAGENDPVRPGTGSASGLQSARIDMTGATPALPRTGDGDAVAGFEGTSVPGLAYCRKYHIMSTATSRYISEEQAYGGNRHNMLRARTLPIDVGGWEQFEICSNDGGHTVYIMAPSGYLVTADYALGGRDFGMLRGRGEWVDAWETFDVWSDDGKYYLRNVSKGTYFTCRVDYTGQQYQEMKATGTGPGSWEGLLFVPV